MKLDCVLTACNADPLYVDFIPIFIRTWTKLYPNIDVKIVLVAHEIPAEFREYKGNIILFPPIPGIHDAYISQTIRLLYPGLLSCEGAVLITDMDMLPMNRTYFTEPLTLLDNDTFVHFRNGVMQWRKMNQYAICYNAAHPSVWREITGVSSPTDICSWLTSNYKEYDGKSDGVGWYSDQVVLYSMITNWSKKDTKLICLKDKEIGFRRLDRSPDLKIDQIIPFVKQECYSDYHCLRPYKMYKTENDTIIDNLPSPHYHIDRTFSEGNYGTHIHPLITAVLNTSGSVLEMGCGDYSTPILHEICKRQNRFLLSCDTSKEWIKLFLDLESSKHNFKYVPVYSNDWDADACPYLWNDIGNDQLWSVVFIDHRPAEQRKVDIKRFSKQAEIIVVHDTEELGYECESVFHLFKYRYDYKRYKVCTTLVSNVVDVSSLFK